MGVFVRIAVTIFMVLLVANYAAGELEAAGSRYVPTPPPEASTWIQAVNETSKTNLTVNPTSATTIGLLWEPFNIFTRVFSYALLPHLTYYWFTDFFALPSGLASILVSIIYLSYAMGVIEFIRGKTL